MLLNELIPSQQLLENYFKTDKDLIETYHIYAGQDVEKCAAKTLSDLSVCDRFFELEKDNKKVGFFGTRGPIFLYTLFLLPEHRNKNDLKDFWQTIVGFFPPKFYSALNKKNSRCIEFYIKNGAKIIHEGNEDGNPFVLFEFER